ncbi:hypothetical protein VTI28DRAFT_7588 [Corynascus sepedonium]
MDHEGPGIDFPLNIKDRARPDVVLTYPWLQLIGHELVAFWNLATASLRHVGAHQSSRHKDDDSGISDFGSVTFGTWGSFEATGRLALQNCGGLKAWCKEGDSDYSGGEPARTVSLGIN